MARTRALAVPCPECQVPARSRCREPGGRERGVTHRSRRGRERDERREAARSRDELELGAKGVMLSLGAMEQALDRFVDATYGGAHETRAGEAAE